MAFTSTRKEVEELYSKVEARAFDRGDDVAVQRAATAYKGRWAGGFSHAQSLVAALKVLVEAEGGKLDDLAINHHNDNETEEA